MTTVPTIATPAKPSPMLAAPNIQANSTLSGNQIRVASVTMMPSSEDEQPLNMAGSTLSRSARMLLLAVMCKLNNAGGFGEQVARKDQHNGTDNAEHTDLRPFRSALTGLVYRV